MDFSNVKSKSLSISSINHWIEPRRRGTFVFFNVAFIYKETSFVYQLKVGKKSVWSGIGFHHQIIKTGYTSKCVHCGHGNKIYCSHFKRTQGKLTRAIVKHPDFIKEIQRLRVKLLVNNGIDFLKI